MANGRVFLLDKGFCWIQPDETPTEQIYLRHGDIEGGAEKLTMNEPVEFSVSQDGLGRKRALNARRLDPDRYQAVERKRGTVVSYETRKGLGQIELPDGAQVFVHYSEIRTREKFRTLNLEEEVEFELGERDHRPYALSVVPIGRRKPLEKFAKLGNINIKTQTLARLAQPEKWEYQYAKAAHPRPVLYSYLFHTFARLEEEKKIQTIAKDVLEYACFNTGLVTPNQEQIFALFVPNKPLADDDPHWFLSGFYKESDYKIIGIFKDLPPLANYFDDPGELLYDRRCELYADLDHIILRKDRFPQQFRDNEHLLRIGLNAAKENTKKRVYRNYKTAVPQFHRGKIQLLLPLCIVSPDKADVALVVQKYGDAYRGNTVLTLDQAYNNARLVARPDDEWLQP